MFRFVLLCSTLIGSVLLAVSFPQTAAAKCPDQPGVICPDLRFDFPDDQQLVADRDIAVTARWVKRLPLPAQCNDPEHGRGTRRSVWNRSSGSGRADRHLDHHRALDRNPHSVRNGAHLAGIRQ